jgi:pimeloyl-ACP methyl ester carboxylesterase
VNANPCHVRRTLLERRALIVACVGAFAVRPGEAQTAPRPSPADWAARAGLRVEQSTVPSTRGFGVRLVTSRPLRADSRLPAVLFIPWLSCDPVEVAGATDDGYIRFVRELSMRSRMIVTRVEKPGVAGSAGPDCSVSTLDDDMAAFRAGLDAVRARIDVDTTRVFLVGGSIGGAFAVVLGAESPGRVAGVVSVNSFARTWYEHMIDHERRRLTLLDSASRRLGDAMRAFELFYTGFLIERHTPGQVIDAHPEVRQFWYDTTTGQYGRSAAYFQQVQALDVDAALVALDVPALFIGGEFDWVMGEREPSMAAARVNRFHPGRATARVYAGLSHGLHTYPSAMDAFRGRHGAYDARVAQDVVAWMANGRRRSRVGASLERAAPMRSR